MSKLAQAGESSTTSPRLRLRRRKLHRFAKRRGMTESIKLIHGGLNTRRRLADQNETLHPGANRSFQPGKISAFIATALQSTKPAARCLATP